MKENIRNIIKIENNINIDIINEINLRLSNLNEVIYSTEAAAASIEKG